MTKPKSQMLERKTIINGRRPQNIESSISQQPLVGFSSNFKLKLRGPNQNQKCLNKDDLNQRRPQIIEN